MLSSHQIAAMAQQQTAMFGNMQNYAQQITPPGGMFGGYGTGALPTPPPAPGMQTGYNMLPPSGGLMGMAAAMPYQMPGQYISQGFSEQLAGGAIGAGSGMMSGAANVAGAVTGAAGLATLGFGLGGMATGAGFGGGMAALGALPMGGAVLAAGGIPAMLGAGGLAAGAYAGNEMYQGFRERQDVNRVMRQRFGGQFGVGGGRGGMGFSGQEMGQMSKMMRGMAADDMFTEFDELTRVLDRTSEMGLYRGVQSASQFREKFKTTVSTLKEIAKTMHTSLEEATQFMEGQRNMGFFSGSDINKSLMRTRMNAGATGMSVEQMQAIGQQGTMMGRSMGMLGRTGAAAMQEMASNTAMAMQMGILSDEDIAEATGGLTGAEGAQAYASRMMQKNRRWLKRGPGRVMLAGLWNQEGGIDQEMMQRAMSGDISIGQLRAAGRKNIRETGGRRSEFFLNEDRLGGQLMAQGGGDLMLGVVGEHFARKKGLELDDPIMQRWLQRYSGQSQSEVELSIKQFRKAPEILQEKRVRFAQQMDMEARSRARETTGIQGLRRRMNQMFDKEVTEKLRGAGESVFDAIDESIQGIVDDMEGRFSTRISERARSVQEELLSTGKGGFLGRSSADDRAVIRQARTKYGAGISTGGGGFGWLGRRLGTRAPGLDEQLGALGAGTVGDIGEQGKLDYISNIKEAYRTAQDSIDLTETQQSELTQSITGTIMRASAAADIGKAGDTGAENFAGIQKRIDYLEQHSPVYRDLAKGMSRRQKIALYEKGATKIDKKRALRAYGVTGGDPSARGLAGDLRALKMLGDAELEKSQRFFERFSPKKTTRLVRGGSARGATFFAPSEKGNIDMRGLYTAAAGNEELSRHLEVLANPSSSKSAQDEASLALHGIGTGGGLLSGAEVSADVRRAAKAVATSADDDAEGTADNLKGYLYTKQAEAAAVVIAEQAKQAGKLRDYMRGDIAGRLKEDVDKDALSAFRKVVDARAQGTDYKGSVDELEDEFLMKYGHTEAGANLMSVLGDDPSAVYATGTMRRMREWVKRGGKHVLNKKGAVGERARIKVTLEDMLSGLGAGGLGALTKKKGWRGRQEQRRWIEKIRKGATPEQIMEQMRKVSGGQLELGEGVTTKDLERHLGGLTEEIKSDGQYKVGEYLHKGADLSERAEQRERSGGKESSVEELSGYAEKQVGYLKEMLTLQNSIATKSSIEDSTSRIVEAIGKIDIPGQ